MPNNYNTPPLGARFQDEIDDYDQMAQVPMQQLDWRERSLRRQGHANQNQFFQNRDEDMGAQHQRNMMGVKARAFARQQSDRDLQWRQQQDDAAWKRGMMEKEFGMREKDMEYRRQQDERENKVRYYEAQMRSADPRARLEGERGLAELYKGGGAPGTTSPSASATAPSATASASTAPGVTASATGDPVWDARLKAIEQEEADKRAAAQEERDARRAARTEASEGRARARQREDQGYIDRRFQQRQQPMIDRIQRALNDPDIDPDRRAQLEQELYRMTQQVPSVAVPQGGGMGVGSVMRGIQGAVDLGVDNYNQNFAGRDAKDIFAPTQGQRDSFKAKRMGERGKAVAAVDQAMSVDPDISGDMADIQDIIQQAQTSGTWEKIDRAVYNFIMKTPGNYVEHEVSDPAMRAIKDRVEEIVGKAVAKFGDVVDANTVRAMLLNRIRQGVAPSTERAGQQIREGLRSTGFNRASAFGNIALNDLPGGGPAF